MNNSEAEVLLRGDIQSTFGKKQNASVDISSEYSSFKEFDNGFIEKYQKN